MKITNIDRDVCKNLRSDLETLLKDFASERGVEISIGNMKFTSESIAISMDLKLEGGKTVKEQRMNADLDFYITMNGLVKEKDGRKLIAYNSRQYKFPFIFENSKGKKFKLSHEQAKIYFGK